MRPSNRPKRLVLAATVALLLAVFAISVAVAQGDLGGKLRSGRDVNVPAGETVATDLYVAAGTVTVDGTVQGDLVVTERHAHPERHRGRGRPRGRRHDPGWRHGRR